MAKKKSAAIDFDNLLGSIGSSIDVINPGHNYDAEEARTEKAISCGSRLIDAIVGSPEQPGVLFIGRITELLAVEGCLHPDTRVDILFNGIEHSMTMQQVKDTFYES